MVLDCCPEFYVGGKENLLWQPQNDEHQRRCWLAPKADVAAADPVAKKMPKAVPAGLATSVAPAALSSRYVQNITRAQGCRRHGRGFRHSKDASSPGPMQPLTASQASAAEMPVKPQTLAH